MSLKDLAIIQTIKSFSLTEKIVFYFLAIIFITTGIGLIFKQADALFVEVPASGGTLTEGIIGYPRYINPVLSITEASDDIGSLIFSGLLKQNGDGTLSPDLAESYTVSEDGLTYDVYLKKDLKFHDGQPLNADDVIFTLDKVKDINIKSPEYINWQGVTVNKIDDYHVQFELKTAYAPFAYNLTLGILPKHIWQNINDDQFNFSSYNYEPIGAGPYQFEELKRDNDGLPLSYTLKAFKDYSGGAPYIQKVTFYFYKDSASAVQALKSGRIESLGGISDSEIKDLDLDDSEEIRKLDLLRTFAVFFNQSQSPVLLNHEVREALDEATDRQKIIDDVLGGYGTPAYSPVPTSLLSTNNMISSDTANGDERIENAKKILTDQGWDLNSDGVMEKGGKDGTTTLAFTISTSDNPDLQATAQLLKEMWGKIGAQVEIKTYDAATLNQSVIRPRKYQALLFGEVIGPDADLYPFWHSSERQDPGLNIALYTNIKADKALENARRSTTTEDKIEDYDAFETEISKDIPAVFLYSPQYIYVMPKKLQGFSSTEIETPKDRFEDIEDRYLQKKSILKLFN